jgi:hypothetical protein
LGTRGDYTYEIKGRRATYCDVQFPALQLLQVVQVHVAIVIVIATVVTAVGLHLRHVRCLVCHDSNVCLAARFTLRRW